MIFFEVARKIVVFSCLYFFSNLYITFILTTIQLYSTTFFEIKKVTAQSNCYEKLTFVDFVIKMFDNVATLWYTIIKVKKKN